MIPPIRKIPYATDLSKNAIYAFDHAVDLARRYGAQLLIPRPADETWSWDEL